ncbi:MAG: beta-lactamase family protein, partial [Bdellovibrionales bacterium]|nr:beta-lactamase family protein [Bdellovibrionales bacterium]
MILKLLIFSLLASLVSCGSFKTLSRKKTKEYLAQEGGLKTVVDYFGNANLVNNKVVGMVIAVIRPQGVEYFAYGYRDKEKKIAMTTDTIFQIGSITKVFTASLMSVLEDEKYLDSTLPITAYMKPGFKPRTDWVRHITLEDLASHTSGLPAEYQNAKMLKSAVRFLYTGDNIWKDLYEKELWTFVENYNFGYQERRHFRYSNVAYVLLGGVLGKVVPGKNFDTLIKEEITDPLNLTDTKFVLNKEQSVRLATGYSGSSPPFMRRGIPMPAWEFHEGLKAAGGLYSTAKDLVGFLKA